MCFIRSLIHALADEQDMRKMGGVGRLLPFTYGMILIGSLSLTKKKIKQENKSNQPLLGRKV